jgi:hypothetical protein
MIARGSCKMHSRGRQNPKGKQNQGENSMYIIKGKAKAACSATDPRRHSTSERQHCSRSKEGVEWSKEGVEWSKEGVEWSKEVEWGVCVSKR